MSGKHTRTLADHCVCGALPGHSCWEEAPHTPVIAGSSQQDEERHEGVSYGDGRDDYAKARAQRIEWPGQQDDKRKERERLAVMCEDQAAHCDRIVARYGSAPQAKRSEDEAADWRKIASLLRSPSQLDGEVALRRAITEATGMRDEVAMSAPAEEIGRLIDMRLREAWTQGEMCGRHDAESRPLKPDYAFAELECAIEGLAAYVPDKPEANDARTAVAALRHLFGVSPQDVESK